MPVEACGFAASGQDWIIPSRRCRRVIADASKRPLAGRNLISALIARAPSRRAQSKPPSTAQFEPPACGLCEVF